MVVGVNATATIFGQILSVLRDWFSSALLPDMGTVVTHLVSGAFLVFWLQPEGAVPYVTIGDPHAPVLGIDSDAEEDRHVK
jgi:hypothetical protein